jgi:hypothetical protein
MPARSDYDLWIRVSQQFRLGYISDPLVNYYVHENGLTGKPAKVVRGLEMLLEKHGDFFARNPAGSGRRHRLMGMLYCDMGNASKARAAFRRAAQSDPWEIRNYICLILSLLGPSTFRKAKAFRRRLAVAYPSHTMASPDQGRR